MINGREERDETRTGPQNERSLGAHLTLVMLGLSIGLLLMVLQLWLLTLAFDLYSSGNRVQTLVIACISGFVFLGGVGMLWLLGRGPHMGHRS